MADSNIGWTDRVWNPVVGCSRVSPGCERCYAETFSHRLEGMGQERYRGLTVIGKQGARWTGEVRAVPDVLGAPLGWRKGKRIFVNSMSDLFHEKVPNEYIAAVFGVMAACPQHTFQVLTKRADRMLEWFGWIGAPGYHYGEMRYTPAEGCRLEAMERIPHRREDGSALPGPTQALFGYDARWPLPNVHLGVSVEDAPRAERIGSLLRCPAAVHWLSLEPLLERVEIDSEYLTGEYWPADLGGVAAEQLGARVGWVVVGGESGADRRECDPAWIDSIVDDCTAAGVPVFVKQDSGLRPGGQGRLSAETWARKEFPWVEATNG